MLQAELKILGGRHQGKLIALNTKKFLVGREQDCHLRPNSELVSRHHCVFSTDDFAVRLRDLGSTNGTLVNGASLRGEVLLKSGDRITIGKIELEVIIRQSSGKTPAPSNRPSESLVKSSPIMSTVEIPIQSDEAETSYELASVAGPASLESPGGVPADTAIIGTMPPLYSQPGSNGYPQGYPQMMPQGYPMPGGYMPPQYPQYPSGYGQPPGYGQPMGYPGGFPQMMPMQQGYPVAAVSASEAPAAASSAQMDVRLPDPGETGAKPVAASSGGGAGAKKEEKPSTSAADIIKQYMSRRA